MPQGFSELVKVYIENLNLSQETKKQLLESNPKTLEDVSMWLKNTQKSQQKDKESSFNPFSANTKLNLTKEIELFTSKKTFNINSTNFGFNKNSLVDTDDASWGLSLDKSQSDSISNYSYYNPNQTFQVQRTFTAGKVNRTNFSKTNNTEATQNTTSSNTSAESAARTPEEQIQDNAIASIRENINTSIETVMQQMEEQGIISSAYNSLKEYFDSQMGLSSVCRVIYSEKNTADLLQKAQDKKLTKEEYWKTKISTAIDMIAGNRKLSAEERACLEERLSEFTPEELNALIDKIKYANNEDYEKLNSNLDKYIEEGRNILSRNRPDSNATEINTNPNSIKSLMKTGDAKELMTFEEVWKAERGVDFNPQAIEKYEEAAAKYAMVTLVTNKAQNIHDLLQDSMTLVRGNNQNGVNDKTREAGEKQLESKLITALKTLYGDDEAKINEELQKISNNTISYKDGQIVYSEFSKNNKGYCLLDTAQKLLDNVDANVQKIQGSYGVEYYAKQMASTYEQAYGRKNATQLARAFANDQEEIVGKVRSGVEYIGAGVMVAGMFFCPPAALAGALTASFGGIGVEALNEASRKKGMTEEAKKKITEELLTNAALFAVGGAAGKMGSASKAALLAQKCPTLMACIADIGVDATISLLGDMALTGELDIEGEGLSQILSIISGHVRSAKFGKMKEGINNFISNKTNPTPNSSQSPKHKENLKLLKSKYKNNKEMMQFIKKHINDVEFIELLTRGDIEYYKLSNLINMTDEQIDIMKKLGKANRKEAFNINDLMMLSVYVKPEQIAKLEEHGLLNDIEGRTKSLTAQDLYELADLSDKQWEIIEERGLLKDIQNTSLDGYSIKRMSFFDDQQYQKIIDRKLIEISHTFCDDGNFEYAALAPLISIPDENWPTAQKVLKMKDKLNLTPLMVEELSSLNEKELSRLNEFVSNYDKKIDFDTYTLLEIVQMPDSLYAKLKEKGKLKNINSTEINLISAFSKYAEKKSVREFSKTEKRQFMMELMKNKNSFVDNNVNLKGIIDILPSNEAEYAEMMKKISQSLNISTKPISAEDKAKTEENLNKLAEVLKTTDLSDLEEINLTMPQKEFVAKAEEILKDLSDEEKAKVMDYFGFKIVDGKLTGYPNSADKDLSLADISDPKTIATVEKMKGLVDNYTDNNFITVKDHPELNAVLKEISRLVPEIFNQIDGSKTPVEMLKTLQKIVQKPEFNNLSDSDKKVMITATLLHNTDKISGSTSESAFDAYYIGEKMGLSKAELLKVYKIVEASDLIEKFMNTTKNKDNIGKTTEREKVFDYLAFMLKDSNNFELAQMLYSTKEADGLTRHLDKMLQNRIQEMKANDFLLPQTSTAELEAHAQMRNINGYNVKVVDSSQIPDFYVYIHALIGATTGGSGLTNVANFDVFGLVGDGSVICASYVGNGKAGTIGNASYGLIFDVNANNQHVGAGYDIWSVSKNVNQMLEEYFKESPNGYCNEKKQSERRMIATQLKKILNISDAEYIQRIENIKEKANGEPLTLAKIKEIDPEFGKAFEEFLSKVDSPESGIMRSSHHNEVLVTNPKIKGIFTKDIKELPEDLLKYAQENNIPIVIIK